MQIQEWKQIIKQTKKSQKETAQQNLKVKKLLEGHLWVIRKQVKCSHCGFKGQKRVLVTFKKPINQLTVFQTALLYMVFQEKKLPADYAQYHNCQAGTQFITNIAKINVW